MIPSPCWSLTLASCSEAVSTTRRVDLTERWRGDGFHSFATPATVLPLQLNADFSSGFLLT